MNLHLHAGMCLVHELEELVDDRLQELPVVAQEARVLPHHIPAALGWQTESAKIQ